MRSMVLHVLGAPLASYVHLDEVRKGLVTNPHLGSTKLRARSARDFNLAGRRNQCRSLGTRFAKGTWTGGRYAVLLLGTTRWVCPRSRVSAPRRRPRAPWWRRNSRTRRWPMIAASAWHDALSQTARRAPTATRPRTTTTVMWPARSFSTTIALRMPRSGMGASSTTRYPASRSRGCSREQREHGCRAPGAQGEPHELYFIPSAGVCGSSKMRNITELESMCHGHCIRCSTNTEALAACAHVKISVSSTRIAASQARRAAAGSVAHCISG